MIRALYCPECGVQLAADDLATPHRPGCESADLLLATVLVPAGAGGLLGAPAMLYGHHEEVLVRLIREQNALIAHLVHAAADRGWWARPNGTQLIAHQRAAALDTMLQHMGLVQEVDRG